MSQHRQPERYSFMNPDHSESSRKLPDDAICRAGRTGIDDLVYCLVADSMKCGYRLILGCDFFCSHPTRAEILKKTEAVRPS